jgi:hypothetical protein
MRDGPFYPALLAARLDSGRTLTDVSRPGVGTRTLMVGINPTHQP